MIDETETHRRQRLREINAEPANRVQLMERYGAVYDTAELAEAFEVIGFMAPYVLVRRKSDGAKGSLTFQHSPRYYYAFEKHE